MKKLCYFVSAVLLITAAGCNKNNPVPETEAPNGVPLTLTATIGGPQTRVAITDDEAGRKLDFEWEAGDKLSVVSLDSSGELICNDIFTADAGGTTATFSGTFNGGTDATTVVVFYPALTESYEAYGITRWSVPVENGYSNEGVLAEMHGNGIEFRPWIHSLQTALDYPLHLKNYMILRGEAAVSEIHSGKLSVNLKHMTTVLKLKLTLPHNNCTLSAAEIKLMNADGVSGQNFSGRDGAILSGCSFPSDGLNYVRLCLGSQIDPVTELGTGLTVSGNKTTLYIPMVLYGIDKKIAYSKPETLTIKSGQKFFIYVKTTHSEDIEDSLTFTADKDLEPGKLYTIHSSPST